MILTLAPVYAAAGPGPSVVPAVPALRQAEGGEFEGRYRVGPTTCTVTPIKMAFEVRWAGENRARRFFFDGRTPEGKPVFASENLGKPRDRFIFDDDRYDTGQFVRAKDGKILPVKRSCHASRLSPRPLSDS